MPKKKLRIIIDTNLWISFLIKSDYSKLDHIVFSGNTNLVFSEELLDEFLAVARRPKFRRYFSLEDIEELLELISEVAEFAIVKSKVEICRDAKDNFLLSLAKDSSADFLLTGDSDLLDLIEFSGTKMITITDFISLHNK